MNGSKFQRHLTFVMLMFFAGVVQSSSQEVDYGFFPGNVYAWYTYGKYYFSDIHRSQSWNPASVQMFGATVQRNLIVRGDTIGPNGVGEPVLAGRLSLGLGPGYMPGELNLKWLFGRRPGAVYLSAGIAALWYYTNLYEGSPNNVHGVPPIDLFYALGVGLDMHPKYFVELKWWHAWNKSEIEYTPEYYHVMSRTNIDVFLLTLGISL